MYILSQLSPELFLLLCRIYIAPTVCAALYNITGDSTITTPFNIEVIGWPGLWSSYLFAYYHISCFTNASGIKIILLHYTVVSKRLF